MFRAIVLVFIGGAVGAVIRELLMLQIPDGRDGFPWSIFVANVVASFVLGLVNGLHSRGALGSDANLLVGTGVTGGMSTFSSFAYATFVLWTTSEIGASVGIVYALASLAVGLAAVLLGLKVGGSGPKKEAA